MPSKYKLKENFNVSIETENKFKKPIRKYPQRPIISNNPNELLCIDLIDLSKDERYKHNYIMIGLDAHTRKIFYFWIDAKNKTEIKKGLTNIFSNMDEKPEILLTDGEGAIYSKEIQTWLKENNIETRRTYGNVHNPLVERVIGTLKGIMEKVFESDISQIGTEKAFEKAVQIYNETTHRTIKMSPNDAYNAYKNDDLDKLKQLEEAHHNFRTKNRESKRGFQINDVVRVNQIYHGKFSKGTSRQYFSNELWQVIGIRNTKPKTYILQSLENDDVIGNWYAEEMIKALEK